ncbi:MAG TPA: hypothetical protein QF589_08030, partial [Anaerolineales bacterium]|nr:hypothetical protein [Anaerolineales bacterium]
MTEAPITADKKPDMLRALGLSVACVALILAACTPAGGPVSMGAGDLLLTHYGLGNTWADDAGNLYTEMLDANGSVYFLNGAGDKVCCYAVAEGAPGWFIHLPDRSFASPFGEHAVAVSTPLPEDAVAPL